MFESGHVLVYSANILKCTVSPLSTSLTRMLWQFDHLHLDLVGPLPLSQGCQYLLTCVNRFTLKPSLCQIVLPKQAFLSGWVSRFGIPSLIAIDRGVQFESALWQNLMQLLGTKHIRTTAYHPSANGLVECFHRQLKAALKAIPNPNHWVKTLPLVLLGIQTNVKQDIKCTSAELVYGTTLRLP